MGRTQNNDRPRILVVWWYSLLTIGGTAAAVASFFYLRDLAEYVGWTDYRAWLVPVSLDVLAAAALTAWVYSKRSDWRPFTISFALVLGSGIGNALSHLYGTHHWQPTAPVIVAVGVVPVIAFFVIADLLVRARRDSWFSSSSTAADQPASDPIPAPPPDTGTGDGSGSAVSGSATRTSRSTSNGGRARTASAPAKSPTSRTRRSEHDLAHTILDRNWLTLSGDDLADKNHLSCSKDRALAARKLAVTLSTETASMAEPQLPSDGNGKVVAGISG